MHRDLLLVHQRLIEAAAFASGENVRRQIERVSVGAVPGWNFVADHHRRQRCIRIRLLHRALFGLRRLRLVNPRDGLIRCRNAFEIFLGPTERFAGIEISGDDERSVVRFVVCVKEIANVLEHRPVQILLAPDSGVMVPVHGECGGAQILLQMAVRLILHADPELFLHHLALGLEIGFVHIQTAHAVRFQPQDALQIIAGKSLEEIRVVVVSARVVEPADSFDDARMLIRPHVRGPLEHQMLEQMGESCVAGLFVLPSHVVPHLKIDYRYLVIFQQNHLEAV